MLEYKVEGEIGLRSVNTEKTERGRGKKKCDVEMTLRTLIWVSGSHLFVSRVKTVRKSRTRCTECVVVSTLMPFRIELLVLNSQNSPNLNLNPAFLHLK